MNYTQEEIKQFVIEEDVKFIRLAFTDIYGTQKNISIMPQELDRAFTYGIAIDASAIAGFGNITHSDVFLHPDTSTLSFLPWRPDHGRVVRMYCTVCDPDGRPIEADTRYLLQKSIQKAKDMGITFAFGSEMEFYLFKTDESGNPLKEPYDHAGYMDIAPLDKGENVRREICLTLEQMGIEPESSHHEEGPGQNEIDFRYAEPLCAADNAITFRAVVNTIAAHSGLYADFGPKPVATWPGNGMHINFSVTSTSETSIMEPVLAGILNRIAEMTLFLNPKKHSYHRLGQQKAPRYISWSSENRSQLIRIPAAKGLYRRAEVRSPDPLCNPYLAYSLLMEAGMEGIRTQAVLPPAVNENLFETQGDLPKLPGSLKEAKKLAKESLFLKEHLPLAILLAYTEE